MTPGSKALIHLDIFIYSIATLLIQYLLDPTAYEYDGVVYVLTNRFCNSIWKNGITQDLLKQDFYSVKVFRST